jgi:threonine synthase
MTSLNTTGELSISKEELESINKNFYGEFADDDLTVSAIKNVFDSYGYLMDPHTAVGFAVYDKYVAETNDTTHSVIMSTAHPFKFPEPVAKALNVDNSKDPYTILDEVSTITNVSFPEKLSEVRKSEIRFSDVIEKEEIGNYIKKYIDEISQ